MGKLAWIGYLVFLAFYAWWKYNAAAPDAFSPAYLQSVIILVLMTGVAPFLIGFGLLKILPIKRLTASVVGVVLGAVLCAGGYATFWYLFIRPYGGPPVSEVALRGIGWGALQGGLAAITANH